MINLKDIEEWYSGKALATLQTFVIPRLVEADELGYWIPKISRRLKAALNKQAVAMRFGRENEHVLRSIKHGNEDGWHLTFAMQFGNYMGAPNNLALAERLRLHVRTDEQAKAFAEALRWAKGFKPVAELITLLDMSRPRPVYVFKTLSPTVVANVGKALGLALNTIRMPEIEWKWVEFKHNGETVRMHMGEILWPAGTKHDTSRFASAGSQCHACGHGIRNNFNWAPLVADGPDGPRSLWVGRDCAKKLFGCEVTGDAVFQKTA